MECYIYFIINKVTNERYVGQTVNFTRRQKQHLQRLKCNSHPNPRLQAAWNRYGSDAFTFETIHYDNLTQDELNEKENEYIQKYDSYNHGYNQTTGGVGGDCRSKLSFEQYCFAYFGNKKYPGMTNRTGRYLGVDSSSISAIAREVSYLPYRDRALLLPEEEKNKYIEEFEKVLQVKEKKPMAQRKRLDDGTVLRIVCVVGNYSRGIESTILKKFDLSKGYVFHIFTENSFKEVKEAYRNLSKEERQEIGRTYFNLWDLQQYSNRNLKEEYRDLFAYYDREPKMG